MKSPALHRSIVYLTAALGFAALAACSDPFGFEAEAQEEEVCAASAEWFPTTPALDLFKPIPHPASECPFYRGGWQNFLVATQPDDNGVPAVVSYPTIDTAFTHTVPLPENRSYLGGVKQAGGRQILIDQNGNTLYYGIHFNQAFVDFMEEHGLTTRDGVVNADPKIFFPAGVVEFKSAWQIVESGDSTDDYITMTTTVPTLSQDADNNIVEDRNTPREVLVRLLALHVVYTLPGHPEFIWASFEHSDGTPDAKAEDGHRNVAPNSHVNPALDDPNNLLDDTIVSEQNHLLYAAGTPANEGNLAISEQNLRLDFETQKFPGQQTSIYRMFPASKSHTLEPDGELSSLNLNVEGLFRQAEEAGQLGANDKRGHYRMIGGQWMDKPAYFALNATLLDDETSPFAGEDGWADAIRNEGTESAEFSILAGEDRLSSTAMESFTQAPDSFFSCFNCHNTKAVTAKGVPLDRDSAGLKLLDPKLINVSHVFSEFVLHDIEESEGAVQP